MIELSTNQASCDLSRDIDLAFHNINYGRSLRTYLRQPGFKPVLDKLDAGRALGQLRSVVDGILDQNNCWIAPHAIVFDGFRWYARVFRFGNEVFKDFVLPRILDIRSPQQNGVLAESDHSSHSAVRLQVSAHFVLPEIQVKVIALNYGMTGGKAEIEVRRALLYYANRRLDLDTDPAARKRNVRLIALLSRDAILGCQHKSEEQLYFP